MCQADTDASLLSMVAVFRPRSCAKSVMYRVTVSAEAGKGFTPPSSTLQ